MKKMLTLVAVVLPFLVFGQQPLKKTYGKYLEVSRVRLEGAVFWIIQDSDTNFEYIYKTKEQMSKKQLKCHLKKGKQYAWAGTLAEVCNILDERGYEMMHVLGKEAGKYWTFNYVSEKMLFQQK